MQPEKNLQIRLKQRPVGLPGDECWDIVDGEVGSPGEGEILVRNEYISLDPAMRGWMNEGKSYIPPVGIGEVMRAICVGEVLASRNDKYPSGSKVSGLFGVQQYAVSDAKGATPVDPSALPLPMYLAALGMPGMTAYFGLLDVCQPVAGDTVVVSAAAGAVGQVVGQIARIKGCRVIGIAGGPEKCQYVTDELGMDACIDYKHEDVAAALKKHCPDGVNVYFDNVGGEILDAVLTRLAMGARIAICGAISQYNATTAVEGPRNYLSLLVNRARMQGFVVFDYVNRYREAGAEIAGWMADGSLKYKIDLIEGIERFPSALQKLYTGENFGKLVLKV